MNRNNDFSQSYDTSIKDNNVYVNSVSIPAIELDCNDIMF